MQAEKQVDPVDEQAKAKAALTELFTEVKNSKTPVVVERIAADIDAIVRLVRFLCALAPSYRFMDRSVDPHELCGVEDLVAIVAQMSAATR